MDNETFLRLTLAIALALFLKDMSGAVLNEAIKFVKLYRLVRIFEKSGHCLLCFDNGYHQTERTRFGCPVCKKIRTPYLYSDNEDEECSPADFQNPS